MRFSQPDRINLLLQPFGIHSRGDSIFFWKSGSGELYSFGKEAKEPEKLAVLPTKIKPVGMTEFEGHLYFIDSTDFCLYRIRIDSDSYDEEKILDLKETLYDQISRLNPALLAPGSKINDIHVHGTKALVAVQAGYSSGVYRIDIDRKQPTVEKFFLSLGVAPKGITRDPNTGNIFVADGGNGVLLEFSPDGVRTPGKTARLPTRFPCGLSLGPDGILMVGAEDAPEVFGFSIVDDEPTMAELSTMPPMEVRERILAQMPGKKCAVLLCHDMAFDDEQDEFWNDLVMIREVLMASGFVRENIFVLYGTGQDFANPERLMPRYLPDNIVDYAATQENFMKVMNGLASGNGNEKKRIPKMEKDDYLFLWTFGHGPSAKESGHSKLALLRYDGDPRSEVVMRDDRFAELIERIACDYRVIAMAQCYSGGFKNVFEAKNDRTVILTACDIENSASRADDKPGIEIEIDANGKKYNHGEFNLNLYKAFLNGETMHGAYDFIVANDTIRPDGVRSYAQYYGGCTDENGVCLGAKLTIRGLKDMAQPPSCKA